MMQEKETLMTGTDVGDYFCSTSAEPLHRLLVKDSYNPYPSGNESDYP